MERRKGIPLVALVIFIALLVAIILTCAIILGANKKEEKNAKPQNQNPIASNQVKDPIEPEEDEGTTIDNEDILNADTDIQDAYKLAGNGKTFAKYAIYSSGGFDTEKNNLKNNLKLQLAMAQVTNSDMDKTSTTKSVPKEKVETYVQKIFEESEDVEYKDFSLYESDTNFTDAYKTIGYVYNEDKDAYEIQENDVTEDAPPEVTEIMTKAIKYNSKLEIYVKPLFIETFYSSEANITGCNIFGGYNFQTKEFENIRLAEIAYSDYNGILRSEYNKDLDKYKYSEVSGNIDLNQIKEYKYTFIKTDDGYKIKSFEEIKGTSSGTSEKQQMTDEEIEELNSTINEYVGSNKKSSDVKELFDTIIEKNDLYEEKVEIILDDSEPAKTEERIKELEELIDTDEEYTLRATYSSGKITTVKITKQ